METVTNHVIEDFAAEARKAVRKLAWALTHEDRTSQASYWFGQAEKLALVEAEEAS